EQRADGRPAIFRELDDNSLNNWIAEYEARNPEARQDLLDIVADVRAFQDYGAELVSPEDLARVRLKKDGTEFQFWTPIQRATPDDVATPVISGQNIGTVGRQKILQEQLGSDLPPDVSFDALTDYVETVYKQVNQAKVARTVTENVQAGLVPGARVIQTGDETARISQLRQNLSELRDVSKSLQTELKAVKSKVRLAKKDVAIAGKQLGIADEKQAGKVRMATSEANRRVNEATAQARRLLKQTLGDDVDSVAAIDSLTPDELVDLLGVSTQDELFSKGAKGKAQFKAVGSSKSKLDAAQQITKQQEAAYARIAKKSEAHRQMVERLQDLKMNIESADNARKGIGRELVELRPDSITGRQTILGIDENGNKFRVELPPEYASVLQGTDKEQMNGILRGFRLAQQPFREAYTGILNPAFLLAQATFNAIWAPILKGPKVFGPRAMKAAFSALNQHSLNQQMLREAGITIYGGNLQKLVKDTSADAIAAQADTLTKLKWNADPRRAWQQLSLAGGKIDQMARAAVAQVEYDNAIKKSLTHEEALANAAYTYDNAFPNFGNAASLIQQADTIVPYFSAGQTGTRAALRAVKENPVGVGGRIAAFGLAVSGLTAYNLAKDEGEAFYADMENSGKKYVLDNNLILVLPGARKDPKTGEWTGIIKLGVTPELRPVVSAINASFSPTQSGIPVKQLATAVFDFVTGGTRNNRSPALETGYGVVTGKDPRTGRDIYDETMTEEERRAAAGKYVAGNFGIPGKVIANQDIGEVFQSFKDRVYGAKGISEGGQYYKNEGEAIKQVGLNKNELDAYRSVIAPRSKDLAGNDIKDKTYYDSASKATTWLRYPKTFEVSKAMDAKNRAAGKPGDPLYDLPPDQLKIVLNLMANYSPGNFEEKAIQQLNPWIKDFNKKRSEYFDKVIPADKKGSTDAMGITIPKATPQLQTKLDQVSKITDKKQKAQYYADNPDITDYYKQTEDYQRTKRAFLGLPQFDRYPTASKEVQGYMDTYNALPKGNGPLKKDGTPSSPARSAWIKSHPNEWAKMTEQWTKIDTFQLQEEGAKAVYEGIDMEQETLAKALGMSGQDFYKQYGNIDKETALNLLKLLSPDKDYTFKSPDTKIKVQKVRYKIPKSVGKKSKVKLG
ncbi:MAG TPA: hypothetical protein PKV66_00680, partial [Candidatus Pelethenecus sp.]|nr:hypothetical protein [Candidatus Pelethenecus sp.]